MSEPINLIDMTQYKAAKQWHGHDRYECPKPFCKFDTLHPEVLRSHLINHRDPGAPAPDEHAAQEEG